MTRVKTIHLYSEIFNWSEASAKAMVRQISEAEKDHEEIALHVHSYGGSVFEGNMIMSAIRNCSVPVTVTVDGIAASMAAMLVAVGTKAYMAENTYLMFHAPAAEYVSGRGTAEEHQKIAKLLASLEEEFVKTIAARTGKGEDHARQLMQGDNWFSAEQALAEGLIDGIVKPVTRSMAPLNLEQVRASSPKELYSLFTAELKQPEQPEQTENNHQNPITMNVLEQIAAALGLSATPTEAQALAMITKYQADAAKVPQLEAQVAAYEKAEKERKESAVTAYVDAQIAAKKATASQRQYLLGYGLQDFEGLKGLLGNAPEVVDLSEAADKGNPNPPDLWAEAFAEIDKTKTTK